MRVAGENATGWRPAGSFRCGIETRWPAVLPQMARAGNWAGERRSASQRALAPLGPDGALRTADALRADGALRERSALSGSGRRSPDGRRSPGAVLLAARDELGQKVSMKVALLGGTGHEGRGLAMRWARAGHHVVVGSRDVERARSTAESIARATCGHAEGATNELAAAAGELAVLAVPFAALAPLLEAAREHLAGKVVISTVVPIDFSTPHPFAPPHEGSAAELAQVLLPNARVVAAFHHVAAHDLEDLSRAVDGDVLLAGNDKTAKSEVAHLVRDVGARPVDVGALPQSAVLEAMTTLLIRINRLHRTKSAGFRVTGLPDDGTTHG